MDRPPFAPIFPRCDYRYLGVAPDRILKKQNADRVEQYKLHFLGCETALSAARKFSNGRVCGMGEGAGSGLQRQSQQQGGFNYCFWVQVEGDPEQWVVRFPLKGLASDPTILTRLRSEIATMQFLSQHTRVPVPEIVGYNVNECDGPLFMIMKSVEGMPMTYLHALNIPSFVIDQVCRDLARIMVELLSHPADRVGMLDLPLSSEPLRPTLGPYSLDAMTHEEDGVYTTRAQPFASAQEYYKYKCNVWRQRLEGQRNAVTSIGDATRKVFNETILSQGIDQVSRTQNDSGPFYLVHPDLHGSNVILDPATFRIISILDWEGACFLPLASLCTPPKALFPHRVYNFVPGSLNYQTYYTRSKRYVALFSVQEQRVFGGTSSVAATMESYIESNEVFLIWALDDLRNADPLLWQHVAPWLFPDFKARLDALVAQVPEDEARALAVTKFCNDFALEQLRTHGDWNQKDSWIKGKIEVLKDYMKRLRTSGYSLKNTIGDTGSSHRKKTEMYS